MPNNQTDRSKLSASNDHRPSVRLLPKYLVRKMKALATMLPGIQKNIIKLIETVDTQTKRFEYSLNVVKNCQELANSAW